MKSVGFMVGEIVGVVGDTVGAYDVKLVGVAEGVAVVGEKLGAFVGATVGVYEVKTVGVKEGAYEGVTEGSAEGSGVVGCKETVGAKVGEYRLVGA
jgi:hypothetical protein